MKRALAMLVLLLMCAANTASAEGMTEKAFQEADPSEFIEFARDYGAADLVEQSFDSALKGNASILDDILSWSKEQVSAPMNEAVQAAVSLLPLILLAALMRCTLPAAGGGSEAVMFLVRLKLILLFSQIAAETMESASGCLTASKQFTGIVSPAVTLLVSAAGMEGTAALVSPAASLAGDLASGLFSGYGLMLCRLGLCTAIAGGLGKAIRLDKITRLIRKTANWGAGLAVAVFTALLALQGTAAEGMDGVAVRTAKYAVDSASSIIGSGVSDVWESYVSGIMIAKNALGISGMAAIMAAAFRPMVKCLLCYILLSLAAAVMDVFGENEGASCAEHIAGICQMALSLCTASLAIAVILLGTAMSIGTNLLV